MGLYHRPINTIRSLLVYPKNKPPGLYTCGVPVVYKITCQQCRHLYVGETGRTLATRRKDRTNPGNQNERPHQPQHPANSRGDHCRDHGNVISSPKQERCVYVSQKEGWFKHKVRETIEIKTLPPTINRDYGFDLPAIYRSRVKAVARRTVTQH